MRVSQRTVGWRVYSFHSPRIRSSVISSFAVLATAVSVAGGWIQAPSPTSSRLTGIYSDEALFVATGDNETVITSADGLNWTKQQELSGNFFTTIKRSSSFVVSGYASSKSGSIAGIPYTVAPGIDSVFGNGVWVSVGYSGYQYRSSNGSDWTKLSNSTTQNLSSVAYANGLFVTVGAGGTILTSGNGTVWAKVESGTTFDVNSVCYGNAGWIAVGSGGLILGSKNGVQWARFKSPVAVNLHGVCSYGGTYLACGDSGTILESSDAATWTTTTFSTLPSLDSVTMNSKQAVAIGKSGVILARSISDGGQPSGPLQVSIRLVPEITITGAAGASGIVQWSSTASGPWQTWTNVTLGSSGISVVDLGVGSSTRFYRATKN